MAVDAFLEGESYPTSGEGIKSLYELVDKIFEKYKDNPVKLGYAKTVLENCLSDSDWHRW